MAEQQQAVDVNAGQNSDQNTNNNLPDYSNNQAWAQYWQYYYSYYMYYYTSYYYTALCQNSGNFVGPGLSANVQPPTAQLNGARVLQNDQGLIHGGLFRLVDLTPRNLPQERYEYKVASLGRRVFAEFIDFVFLYFLKYSIFLLYYKDPDKLNSQFQYILVIDENTSLKDLEDVLIQALVYRFIVFLYEALFLAVPFPCPTGGATLGKYMMGLTVVLYPSLTPIQGQNLRRFTGYAQRLSLWHDEETKQLLVEETVFAAVLTFIADFTPTRVNPLGPGSCVRATLKNFMITFFFPIIFTTMFLQNFRTPYDFMASSVVVDANPRRLPAQQN